MNKHKNKNDWGRIRSYYILHGILYKLMDLFYTIENILGLKEKKKKKHSHVQINKSSLTNIIFSFAFYLVYTMFMMN